MNGQRESERERGGDREKERERGGVRRMLGSERGEEAPDTC